MNSVNSIQEPQDSDFDTHKAKNVISKYQNKLKKVLEIIMPIIQTMENSKEILERLSKIKDHHERNCDQLNHPINRFDLVVLGQTNAGKSTLMNRIIQ